MRRTVRELLPQLLVCVFLVLPAPTSAVPAPAPREFTVAVVQAEVSEQMFSSVDEFATIVRESVDRAVTHGANLVVFPEYLNVFLAAIPYNDIVRRSSTVEGVVRRMNAAPGVPSSPRELFAEQGEIVRAIMDRIYGTLARRNDLHILAGSYFAVEEGSALLSTPGPQNVPCATGRIRLFNRSVLYGPDGTAIHEQDKVFLTGFERDLLGLDAGDLMAVEPADVDGLNVGVTICRDIFFPVWEQVHEELDVWVDLRAEGTRWQQGRKDFTEVLPRRILASGSASGITVSLTGEYLDLFWEGKSAVVTREEGRTEFVAVADSATGQEILVVTLQVDREE